MKMLIAVCALVAFEAVAQDGIEVVPAIAAHPDLGRPPFPPVPAIDALLEEDPPLIENPDGSMPEGPSVRLKKNQLAPFGGWLVSSQEHTRRARINRGKELTVDKAKAGNVLLPTPALIGIIAGVAVVVAAGSIGIYEAARPKPGQSPPGQP